MQRIKAGKMWSWLRIHSLEMIGINFSLSVGSKISESDDHRQTDQARYSRHCCHKSTHCVRSNGVARDVCLSGGINFDLCPGALGGKPTVMPRV